MLIYNISKINSKSTKIIEVLTIIIIGEEGNKTATEILKKCLNFLLLLWRLQWNLYLRLYIMFLHNLKFKYYFTSS